MVPLLTRAPSVKPSRTTRPATSERKVTVSLARSVPEATASSITGVLMTLATSTPTGPLGLPPGPP